MIMSWVFKKHYTRQEARTLLPELERWLDELKEIRTRLTAYDQQMSRALAGGAELGGEPVNIYLRTIADVKELLARFRRREIQIKDLERGLIDFPSLMAGKEVFLCWQKGEPDIEYWHELESGFAGRERFE